MHHPYDQRCKALLAAAFESVAEAEMERAVHVPPQRIDVAFEPKPGVRAPELGLLDRIVAEGPGMIEYYSHTVRANDVEECQRKRHSYTHERRLAAKRHKPADPLLWIVSMGRPRKALKRYEAQVMEGWPTGCWRTREVDRTRFVVLNDLPETIETVLLRLLGRGRRFHRALAELMALPEEHPLVRRVRKVVVAFWDPIVQDLTRSGDMNALQ
uniref:hypothetical protein n=1 Tax=Haliangium sp. TaxID=2663208 RepID=UPI003D1389F6